MEAAEDKKAQDILVLDVSKTLVIANYFVILSGKTTRQTKVISDDIRERLTKERIKPLGTEGEDSGRWILLDFSDVLVHIFTEEEREYYQLERLWKDVPRLQLGTIS